MLRTCWTCGGYGSVPGFWLGSRKKCPACGGRGSFEMQTSSSGVGHNVTLRTTWSVTPPPPAPSLTQRLLRWLRRVR